MTPQNLNREQAEAAARAGATVRHESWHNDAWVTFRGAVFVDEVNYVHDITWPFVGETGWSIVTPAPDTAKAETDAPSAVDRVRDLYAKKQAQGLVDVKFNVKPGATAEQLAEEILSMESAIQAGQFKTLRFGDVTLKKTTPPEPWRPTIGRDAVTRDGRRARNVRAYDDEGPYAFAADIDGVTGHTFTASGWFDGSRRDTPLDLIGDWIEPEQAETPKHKWGKWEAKGFDMDPTGEITLGEDVRVTLTRDGFSIKRRVK